MQNLHRHTSYSNVCIADSAATNEQYAKRAVELGHKVISSVEHGWQGYYYQCYELAQKYNLKFVFGAEAYWVKDRQKEYEEIDPSTGEPLKNKDGTIKAHKDNSNCHILLLAKTEIGRRAINKILSEANETGYYFRPRVDLELLLSLPPDDVVVTTACVAYWKYDDIEDITLQLWKHFGKNFYLEIQAHNTDQQREISRRILSLSQRYGIEMIVGLDSHYIYPEQAQEREYILEAKDVHYKDEEGWYMDYPDDEEVMRRFMKQGVFTKEQVQRAMDNTDISLTFDDYAKDNPVFSKDIKLPTLYPNLSQEERNKKYSVLISKLFREYAEKHHITGEEYKRYLEGIKMEVQTVKDTGMADYFLLDYEIVKKAIEKGGVLTDSGRGSSVGYFTNTLLGFSKVDRFQSPITLYPERFISKTRILETHSLPDIDMNWGTPEIAEEAQKEILGDDHAIPMIAFGTCKKKSAFKLFARSQNMDFELANTISSQIADYEEAVKNAEDDDKDQIDIYDFVDKKYSNYIEQSKKYWGIIMDKKKAPCFPKGTLVYTNDGYKPIETISVGDKVLTHAGRFCDVLYVNKTADQQLYKLKSMGREDVYLTENHPVLCRRLKRERYKQDNGNWSIKRTFSEKEWIKAKDIFPHDVVGSVVNSNSIIPNFSGLEKYLNNKDFWWIVGRWVGDGWCEYYEPSHRKRIKICCAKSEKEVSDISRHLNNLIPYRVEENRTVYKFLLKDSALYEFFQNFGRYANGKKIPQFVIDLPIDLLSEFLTGYISADGHYQKDKKQFILSSVSKELIYGLQQCIHKVYKVPTNFQIRPENIDIIEGRQVRRKESYIIKFHLDKRKNDRSFYEDGYIWYWVHSISETERYEDVYNFEVDKDNSYTVYNMCVHNCAFLLYQGNIREEIGLIKCKSESTGKEFLTAVVDGAIAENYKFLKNDILCVSIVLLVDKIYRRIGIPHKTVEELKDFVKNDPKTWDIYRNGYTLGVNQCEQVSSAKKMMRFQAKNISELSAWIAAIRPAFKSMYSKFESRESFSYGIPAFDKLLQTEELPQSWILYQEQSMSVLSYAGFPMDECYGIIKAIAKKHPEKVRPLKDRFIEGFKKRIITEEGIEENQAQEMSERVWQIINDSCGYGFNSAHAYCMAIDSLSCAMLKANYPYEFYEVLLQFHSDRGEKDKVGALKAEMKKAFGIQEGPYRFGEDNRKFNAIPERGIIQPSLLSIKGLSQDLANDLYELSQTKKFDNFIDLLREFDHMKSMNVSKLDTLIKLNYFSQFAPIGKLLNIVELYNKFGTRKTLKESDVLSLPTPVQEVIAKYTVKPKTQYKITDNDGMLRELAELVGERPITMMMRLGWEQQFLGYCASTDPSQQGSWLVLDIDTKFSPKLTIFAIWSGEQRIVKVSKRDFQSNPLTKGDTIRLTIEQRPKAKLVDRQWVKDESAKEDWLKYYSIIK